MSGGALLRPAGRMRHLVENAVPVLPRARQYRIRSLRIPRRGYTVLSYLINLYYTTP